MPEASHTVEDRPFQYHCPKCTYVFATSFHMILGQAMIEHYITAHPEENM